MDWEKILNELIIDGQKLDVRLICGWHNNMQKWVIKRLRATRLSSELAVPEEQVYPSSLFLRESMTLESFLAFLHTLMNEAGSVNFRNRELFHYCLNLSPCTHHSGYIKLGLGTSSLPLWRIGGGWSNFNQYEFMSYVEPLISLDDAPYFPRIVDGEVWYLYNKAWTGPGELAEWIDISIIDERAYFTGVDVKGDTYTIRCQGDKLSQADLHLFTSELQFDHKKAEAVNTFVIQGHPERITLVLVSAGEWFDRRDMILYGGRYQVADDVLLIEDEALRDEVLTIKELIARWGESTTLEFKEQISGENYRFLKTVVAFANTQGGTILLGVNDEGHATGLAEKDTKQQVINLIEGRIRRSLSGDVQVFPEEYEGKQILVIQVPEGANKPYALVMNSNDPQYYIRRDGSNKRAYPDEMERLLRS